MKIKALIATAALMLCVGAVSGCANKGGAKGQTYVVESVDNKYDLAIESTGTCNIYNHGESKSLLEGFVKIREENSAVTLSFGYDLIDVKDAKLHYLFDLDIKDKNNNDIKTSFKIHRGKLMKGLGQHGVVYNETFDDNGESTATEFMMSFSLTPGVLVWDNKMDLKIIKVQCSWDYSYSIAEGLKVWVSGDNAKRCAIDGVEKVDTNWEVHYDAANCNLPRNLCPPEKDKGTIVFEDAAFRSALLLD